MKDAGEGWLRILERKKKFRKEVERLKKRGVMKQDNVNEVDERFLTEKNEVCK